MTFTFDQDLHIHSALSRCVTDKGQSPSRILQYAIENHLDTVCLTNQYWDAAVPGASRWYMEQNFEHLKKALPLPSARGVRFLFGCEADMTRDMRLTIPTERFDDFDLVLISLTHFNHSHLALPKDAPARERAKLWADRLSAVLDMPLPFHKVGLAHLACSYMDLENRQNYIETLNTISADTMTKLFSKAARLGVGIELNRCDMNYSEREAYAVLRMFRIARDCGCRFYCGSDAHDATALAETPATMARAIRALGLQEADKFRI